VGEAKRDIALVRRWRAEITESLHDIGEARASTLPSYLARVAGPVRVIR
jgi:hypothetical protein